MAESSLTLGFPELKQAVGFFLGKGTTIDDWSAAEESEIEDIVQTGYRQVLYPPAIVEDIVGYEWSFLRPTTTLDIEADDGDYDLPDDFGRLVGRFHYEPDEHRTSIAIVSLAAILDMRSHSDQNSAPAWAAIRYKSADGTDSGRQEVLFYPEPDADYTLHYSYDAYRGALTDDAPYPLGGMQMSELYKESCLAAAESRMEDSPGTHTASFERLLIDRIARDRKRGPQNYGNMGQARTTDEDPWRRGSKLYSGAFEITYHDEYI